MKNEKSQTAKAASIMGRRSAKVRLELWGPVEFRRRLKEWGKLGGRPQGTGAKQKAVTKGAK